jgi:hypothetical protein
MSCKNILIFSIKECRLYIMILVNPHISKCLILIYFLSLHEAFGPKSCTSLPFLRFFSDSFTHSELLFFLTCDNGNYRILMDKCLLCASCCYGSTGHAMLPHMCGRVLDMPCSPTCVAICIEKMTSWIIEVGRHLLLFKVKFLTVPHSFSLFSPLGEVRSSCTILPQIVPSSEKMTYH